MQLAISELQMTLSYVLYVLHVMSAVALKWQVQFENGMKMNIILMDEIPVHTWPERILGSKSSK